MEPLEPALVERFRADLVALTGTAPDRLCVAVSGGPDSLALLRLAAQVLPDRVEAATIDHGLRVEAAAEAEQVAGICERLGVPHRSLAGRVQAGASVQAQARALRYRLLGDWAAETGAGWLATGHHLDDQAETLLMRLARGAGAGGLAGIRAKRPLREGVTLIRPLLGWRRNALAAIAAGLEPVDDPSNRDEAHDRTRFRRLLADAPELDPERLAAAAAHLGDAEAALGWAAEGAWAAARRDGAALLIDPTNLPREIRRRLLVRAIETLRAEAGEWRRDGVGALLDRLEAGETATLAGIKAEGGSLWRLQLAPQRR